MGATTVVVGHPINICGTWLQPTSFLTWTGAVATAAAIPVGSLVGGQAEASVLLGQGNATIIG